MGAGRDRKRTIKAARKVPAEHIHEVLPHDEDIVDDHFLVYNRDLDFWSICCWSRTNGMMTTTIEDEALYLACVEYMQGHGYLIFDSMAEVHAHARAQGWT
jgi:hypothetical protein